MRKIYRASILTMFILGIFSFVSDDNIPKGWHKSGGKSNKYFIGIDNQVFKNGTKSVFIKSKRKRSLGLSRIPGIRLCTIMQTCSTKDYLGKVICVGGHFKLEKVKGWAGVWIQIDCGKDVEQFDFSGNRGGSIRSKYNGDWGAGVIELYIPKNSKSISFGGFLCGTGKVWFDNFRIEIRKPPEGDKELWSSSGYLNDTPLDFKPHDKPMNLDFED